MAYRMRWSGACLLLMTLAAGCGGDDVPASATMRPIGAPPAADSGADAQASAAVAVAETVAGFELEANQNRAPRVVGLQLRPADSLAAGRDVWARGSASDPDGDATTIEYSWLINGDRVDVEGDKLETDALRAGDTVQVEVRASDGRLNSEVLASPVLTVENAPPAIISKPGAPGADGVFRYAIKAEDPDGDSPLRYRLEAGPPGMTVTPAAGQVEWRLPMDGAGVYQIALAVEDANGGVGFQRFALTLGSLGN